MNAGAPKKIVNKWQAVGFVWEVVMDVAIPTTIFALAGRWADKRWHLSPWMTVFGLALAMAITYVLMKRKANEYRRLFT